MVKFTCITVPCQWVGACCRWKGRPFHSHLAAKEPAWDERESQFSTVNGDDWSLWNQCTGTLLTPSFLQGAKVQEDGPWSNRQWAAKPSTTRSVTQPPRDLQCKESFWSVRTHWPTLVAFTSSCIDKVTSECKWSTFTIWKWWSKSWLFCTVEVRVKHRVSLKLERTAVCLLGLLSCNGFCSVFFQGPRLTGPGGSVSWWAQTRLWAAGLMERPGRCSGAPSPLSGTWWTGAQRRASCTLWRTAESRWGDAALPWTGRGCWTATHRCSFVMWPWQMTGCTPAGSSRLWSTPRPLHWKCWVGLYLFTLICVTEAALKLQPNPTCATDLEIWGLVGISSNQLQRKYCLSVN